MPDHMIERKLQFVEVVHNWIPVFPEGRTASRFGDERLKGFIDEPNYQPEISEFDEPAQESTLVGMKPRIHSDRFF